MSTSKKELLAILTDEADRAEDVSPLALRLLSEDELDWISGGGSHSQSGSGSNYTMSGENSSYTQSGGTYFQNANSFPYMQSWGIVGKAEKT